MKEKEYRKKPAGLRRIMGFLSLFLAIVIAINMCAEKIKLRADVVQKSEWFDMDGFDIYIVDDPTDQYDRIFSLEGRKYKNSKGNEFQEKGIRPGDVFESRFNNPDGSLPYIQVVNNKDFDLRVYMIIYVEKLEHDFPYDGGMKETLAKLTGLHVNRYETESSSSNAVVYPVSGGNKDFGPLRPDFVTGVAPTWHEITMASILDEVADVPPATPATYMGGYIDLGIVGAGKSPCYDFAIKVPNYMTQSENSLGSNNQHQFFTTGPDGKIIDANEDNVYQLKKAVLKVAFYVIQASKLPSETATATGTETATASESETTSPTETTTTSPTETTTTSPTETTTTSPTTTTTPTTVPTATFIPGGGGGGGGGITSPSPSPTPSSVPSSTPSQTATFETPFTASPTPTGGSPTAQTPTPTPTSSDEEWSSPATEVTGLPSDDTGEGGRKPRPNPEDETGEGGGRVPGQDGSGGQSLPGGDESGKGRKPIPKTGEDRSTQYLFIIIVCIFISFILLKKTKKNNDGEEWME